MSLDLLESLPADWRDHLGPLLDPPAMAALSAFVAQEYSTSTVYPPVDDLFNAFRHCSFPKARVLILGQDPYHKAGQAHGLSFSVRPGVSVPPSLRQVYQELGTDLGVSPPSGGDLTRWAEQGVLLLNAVLTVRAASPASHANQGWEQFTDAAIMALNDRPQRVVFLLWGSYARKKAALVTAPQHVVLEAGHPSPMNPKGFLGSRPFSAANAALVAAGESPIAWA